MLVDEEKVTLIIGSVPQSMVVAMMQAAQQAGLDLSLWLRLVVEAELKREQITGLYGIERILIPKDDIQEITSIFYDVRKRFCYDTESK